MFRGSPADACRRISSRMSRSNAGSLMRPEVALSQVASWELVTLERHPADGVLELVHQRRIDRVGFEGSHSGNVPRSARESMRASPTYTLGSDAPRPYPLLDGDPPVRGSKHAIEDADPMPGRAPGGRAGGRADPEGLDEAAGFSGWEGRIAARLMERVVRPFGQVAGPTAALGIVRPFVAVVSALELAYSGPIFAELRERLPTLLPRRRAGGWTSGASGRASTWRRSSATGRTGRRRRDGDGSADSRGSRASPRVPSGAGARPGVLVTLHFGPVEMLYYRLRSRRVPVAALAAVGECATGSGSPHPPPP